jgi:allantoicase
MSEPFRDLPDLASETVGGAAILTNDEFFAEKENLLRAHEAVWKEHEYTERGKWMDGWESRRRRDGGTHDWCIVRLGLPGVIRGVVVDTAFFRGNFPESCALFATMIDDPLDLDALQNATWTEIVPRSTLRGDSKNAFAVDDGHRYTHVRLDIYPDGGVARLRVHGDVVPNWPRLRSLGGPIDLAALEHGAVVETCSDMFFGSRNNLIKPGPSMSMADGWETRRRRGPGNDWAIVRLAASGNDRARRDRYQPLRATRPGARARGCTRLASREGGRRRGICPRVEGRAASPSHFDHELRRIGHVTHLRLSVFPCGGIARFRAWGGLSPEVPKGLTALNATTVEDAKAAFKRCCGSTKWAEQMAAMRPFEDVPAVMRIGERIWWSLGEADYREAFAAHPKIGHQAPPKSEGPDDPETTGKWSRDEQKSTTSASPSTLSDLADANIAYGASTLTSRLRDRPPAEAKLEDLQKRLPRSAADELRTAAEEQAKITRLRLTKLMGELG